MILTLTTECGKMIAKLVCPVNVYHQDGVDFLAGLVMTLEESSCFHPNDGGQDGFNRLLESSQQQYDLSNDESKPQRPSRRNAK